MAKKTTEISDDAPKKKSGAEKHLAVWLLLAMIITGLGGWGVTNFGNSITAIGKVGKTEIDARDYQRQLRAALANFSQQIGTTLTLQQAQAFGLDRQVLEGLVQRTALDAEMARIGLSVGDTVVAEQVKANRAFQGAEGFDREAYKMALQNSGMTERDYESGLRRDVARQILLGAVTGGLGAPQTLVEILYAHDQETRGFTALQLTEAGLPAPIPAPTAEELKAFYDAHLADFTRPEGKRITYAALLPEKLAETMPVDEAAVKALYEARADQYNVPEKRLVERLVYPSEDEAKAAKAKLDAGEATFEDLVKARGLALEDIDMGDVSAADLGEAGSAVFALTGPGVVGPLPSALGPALYRMNAVLAAQVTPLEAVKDELAREGQLDAAKKAISDRVEAIDDALAGGATLEDLVKEQPGMVLVTTDYAPGADDNDPLAADSGFAKQAGLVQLGDYPEAVALDNGGLVAMRVDADVPAAPVPLEKITDKVTAAWHAEKLQAALAVQAVDVKSKVETGASLGAFGITSVSRGLKRDAALTDMPAAVLEAAFALAEPGQVQIVTEGGFVGLVRLDAITPAPTTGAEADQAREAIAADLRQSLGDDISALYTQAILGDQPVQLDQAAINAVNGSFR